LDITPEGVCARLAGHAPPPPVAQLWLFIIASLIGAGLAGVLYRDGAFLDAPTEG
jgi:hypothetical protein